MLCQMICKLFKEIATLNNILEYKEESDIRVQFVLSLPEEERSFLPPKPSCLLEQSGALVVFQNPMSEFGEFDFDEIEEMTKSSSKKSSSSKTPSSGRLLPLRSSNKKARLEPITVEDDPEPKSVPVNAVPIAQIEPHPAIRDPQNAVLQSFYDLSVATNALINDFKKTIEKEKQEKNNMSGNIAKLSLENKVKQTEYTDLQKKFQAMIRYYEQKLEDTKESVRKAGLKSGQKIFMECRVRMAKEAEAKGFTMEEWNIEEWQQELLEKFPPATQSGQKSISSEKKIETTNDVEASQKEAEENEVAEDLVDKKVEEVAKEVGDVQMSDEGQDNQA